METWPNFFIVGASKAGTTSLYEYLKKIPEIYMSTVKEPSYFCTTSYPENLFLEVIRDKKKYLNLFSKVKDEMGIGEASALYLIDPQAPELIYKKLPHARIIIILRDPIERAYSHYLHAIRVGSEKLPFSDAIKNAYDEKIKGVESTKGLLLEIGYYSKPVKKYLDIFGKNQVKIIIFEEFIQNSDKIIKEILNFLGIEYSSPIITTKVYNPYGAPKNKFSQKLLASNIIKKIATKLFSHDFVKSTAEQFLIKNIPKPRMLEKDRLFLKELYKNDVKKLEKILNRSLPW